MPDTITQELTAAEAAAAAADAAERSQLREQIRLREAAATSYEIQARGHEDSAMQMRQIANDLSFEVEPLRTVFRPIRALHIPNTWEGQAATASRTRLDGHEARTNSAIRSIDGLIEDLQDRAVIEDGLGDGLRGQANSLRSGNWTLQRQINALY